MRVLAALVTHIENLLQELELVKVDFLVDRCSGRGYNRRARCW